MYFSHISQKLPLKRRGRLYKLLIYSFILLLGCNSSAQEISDPDNAPEKVIDLLGDSMTWIGGDNCEKETGWSYYLKRYNPNWQVATYARSGATWTNTKFTKGDVKAYSAVLDNENVIYNQVRRLILDVDNKKASTPNVIVIFAGGNDAMYQRKRPGLFNDREVPDGSVENCKPSDFTTLNSSIELGCRLLKEHFPHARIILVTPTEMAKATPEVTAKVGDTIQKIGQKLGIEVLRADKNVNIRQSVEKNKPHKFTYDGIHSNPLGAQLIADYIIKAIDN